MVTDLQRKEVGRIGEAIACQFLIGKGYEIIEKNFRKPWGEIDIIAQKGDEVRFIEVKAVSRESKYYRPEELVDSRKLRKVARTAQLYMEQTHDAREFQIDVVGVIMNKTTKTARCRLFEQALEDNL